MEEAKTKDDLIASLEAKLEQMHLTNNPEPAQANGKLRSSNIEEILRKGRLSPKGGHIIFSLANQKVS